MTENVVEVKLSDKTVFLVGTAHVSQKSVETVRETIEKERPDAVAVELCSQRKGALVDGKKWDETDVMEVFRSGRQYLFLSHLMLANFQRRVGESIGIKPGREMLEAVSIAKEKNIEVALVDRDVKVTLKRAFSSMSVWEKIKLASGFLEGVFEGDEVNEELVEKLKSRDIISELMEELSREIPSVKEVLVDERDRYIALKIASLKAVRVVAVVGAGHVEGIERILLEYGEDQSTKHSIEELEETVEGGNTLKIMKYAIPAIFLAIIGWGFLAHGADFTAQMFLKWFLINGTLSALGVALALGHPLSVASAFFAAPFTSLNPAIAAGWVAGLVELKIRKPRVGDFEGLLKLNSLRDIWGNRITKILLVIIFANIGSSIGTFVALPYLVSLI